MKYITDQELATFIVCPYSWWLKRGVMSVRQDEHAVQSQIGRNEWLSKSQLLTELRSHRHAIYLLLLGLVVCLVIWESIGYGNTFYSKYLVEEELENRQETSLDNGHNTHKNQEDNFSPSDQVGSDRIPMEIAIILLILASSIFVYDLLERHNSQVTKETGIGNKSKPVAIRDQKAEEELLLRSSTLGIMGRPDALIEEQGLRLPLLYQHFGKKVQDRHVIKLVSYLYMLEEQNGTSLPYGILRLGEAQRKIQIKYTVDKKDWLFKTIKEIRDCNESNIAPAAAPDIYKCRHCDVKDKCPFRK